MISADASGLLSCSSLCLCFIFNLESEKDKADMKFINLPGAMELEFLSNSELAVSLWASHWQQVRLSEKAFLFCFCFPSNVLLCLSVSILFVLFVFSHKFLFDSQDRTG